MSLYVDTSCLLKLLFPEPESARVMTICGAEPQVFVSTLARLEALVQIGARVAGGTLSKTGAARLAARLETLVTMAPFEVVVFPPQAVDLAEAQVRPMARATHCRTLDRLHLAVMQSLQLRRILTNDAVQAKAATALGFDVVSP